MAAYYRDYGYNRKYVLNKWESLYKFNAISWRVVLV